LIDLKGFYSAKPLESSKCYETCGGGHCCKFFSLFTHVNFAPKDSLQLYLYPFEYRWLKENNRLDEAFEKTLRNNEFIVDQKKLNFYTINCSYNGLCPHHQYRPLTCFLYPKVPYFNDKGEIISMHNYSIYDDMYDSLALEKPCTIYDNFNSDHYQKIVSTYFNDPEFFFYTNLYVRIKDIMIESWKNSRKSDQINETIGEFETLYLMQKLISISDAKKLVREENKKFNFL
jgi:hypothetical protein